MSSMSATWIRTLQSPTPLESTVARIRMMTAMFTRRSSISKKKALHWPKAESSPKHLGSGNLKLQLLDLEQEVKHMFEQAHWGMEDPQLGMLRLRVPRLGEILVLEAHRRTLSRDLRKLLSVRIHWKDQSLRLVKTQPESKRCSMTWTQICHSIKRCRKSTALRLQLREAREKRMLSSN